MKRNELKPGDTFRYQITGPLFYVPPMDNPPEGAARSDDPGPWANAEIFIENYGTTTSISLPPSSLESVTALPHYITGSIEAIDVIEAWQLPAHLANVVKYIARHGKKPGEDAKKDLAKAQAYLTRYINLLDGRHSWDEKGDGGAKK